MSNSYKYDLQTHNYYLSHYGTKGMRWHVRKGESRSDQAHRDIKFLQDLSKRKIITAEDIKKLRAAKRIYNTEDGQFNLEDLRTMGINTSEQLSEFMIARKKYDDARKKAESIARNKSNVKASNSTPAANVIKVVRDVVSKVSSFKSKVFSFFNRKPDGGGGESSF